MFVAFNRLRPHRHPGGGGPGSPPGHPQGHRHHHGGGVPPVSGGGGGGGGGAGGGCLRGGRCPRRRPPWTWWPGRWGSPGSGRCWLSRRWRPWRGCSLEPGAGALPGYFLAMARRQDAPGFLARVDGARGSPVASVWGCGLLHRRHCPGGGCAGDLVLQRLHRPGVLRHHQPGGPLRLPSEHLLFPRWIPAAGAYWGAWDWPSGWSGTSGWWGLGVLVAGLAGRALVRGRVGGVAGSGWVRDGRAGPGPGRHDEGTSTPASPFLG